VADWTTHRCWQKLNKGVGTEKNCEERVYSNPSPGRRSADHACIKVKVDTLTTVWILVARARPDTVSPVCVTDTTRLMLLYAMQKELVGKEVPVGGCKVYDTDCAGRPRRVEIPRQCPSLPT
jgi:hypothetical protein